MITNVIELREAIQQLETDRVVQVYLLKQEFETAYESIKPFNLIKNNLENTSGSTVLGNNLFSTSIELAIGYLVKQWVIKKSNNPFRAMLGSAVQIGVINLLEKYRGVLEIVGSTLLQLILHKVKKSNDAV